MNGEKRVGAAAAVVVVVVFFLSFLFVSRSSSDLKMDRSVYLLVSFC